MRHRSAAAIRHLCRCHSQPPLGVRPLSSLGAERGGEHVGGDLVAGDLADDEFSSVKADALPLSHWRVGPGLTAGPARQSQRVYRPGAPSCSARVNLIFFICFLRFCSKLAKIIS